MSPAFTLEMDSRMDTGKWLERLKEGRFFDFLDDCGQAGVAALAAATPVRSGYTASSWSYDIKRSRNRVSLVWNNSHVEQGVPIAVILLCPGRGLYKSGAQAYIRQHRQAA